MNYLSDYIKQAQLSDELTSALVGGGLGAVLGGGAGALFSDDETRLRNALIGAALGGTAGGVGGYFGGGYLRNLLKANTVPAQIPDASNISPAAAAPVVAAPQSAAPVIAAAQPAPQPQPAAPVVAAAQPATQPAAPVAPVALSDEQRKAHEEQARALLNSVVLPLTQGGYNLPGVSSIASSLTNYPAAYQHYNNNVYMPAHLDALSRAAAETSGQTAVDNLHADYLASVQKEKERAAEKINQIFSAFAENRPAPNSIPGFIQGINDSIGGAVQATGGAIGDAAQAAGGAIGDAAQAAGNAIGGTVNAAGGWFNNTGRSIGESAYDARSAAGNAANSAWRGAATFITGQDPANNLKSFEGLPGQVQLFDRLNSVNGISQHDAIMLAQGLQPLILSGKISPSQLERFAQTFANASPEEKKQIADTIKAWRWYSKK